MQLLIALFLLLCGVDFKNLGEVKQIAEELGGEQMKCAIEDAEKLCEEAEGIKTLIDAVRTAAGGDSQPINADGAGQSESVKKDGFKGDNDCDFSPRDFPLKPISRIADEGILACLSRYVALGE